MKLNPIIHLIDPKGAKEVEDQLNSEIPHEAYNEPPLLIRSPVDNSKPVDGDAK